MSGQNPAWRRIRTCLCPNARSREIGSAFDYRRVFALGLPVVEISGPVCGLTGRVVGDITFRSDDRGERNDRIGVRSSTCKARTCVPGGEVVSLLPDGE